MGQINLPSLDDITQIKDPKQQMEALLNTVGLLMKSLTEINGYLNSKNIFEAGGWRVTDTELVSKDGDVGMSTEDIGLDDVRFWAGGTVKDTALWRVHKSGQGVATGWRVQSKDGAYPLIVMDPDDDLLAAYTDATHYIRISAYDFLDGIPKMSFVAGTDKTDMYQTSGMYGDAFAISSSDNIVITPGTLATIYLNGIKSVGSFGSVIGSSGSLQAALDSKVDVSTANSTYAVNMSFDSGTRNLKLFAQDGTQIAIVNIP